MRREDAEDYMVKRKELLDRFNAIARSKPINYKALKNIIYEANKLGLCVSTK